KGLGPEERRCGHASASLRQALLEHKGPQDVWVHHAGVPAVAYVTRDHGAGLRVVRPTVSDADRAEQAGDAEASPEPVQASGRDAEETLFADPGESPDVSR